MKLYKRLFDNIYSINTGVATSYLITGDTNMLIDVGDVKYGDRLIDVLEQLKVIEKLDYIFLTHAHHDHCGALKIVSRKTNAKTIIFSPDDVWLSKGVNCDLNPYKLKGRLASLLSAGQDYDWSFTIDMVLKKDTYLDESKKIKAITLPGHTKGSGGILYDNKLFCGDLYTSYIPNHYGAPFFVSSEVNWKASCTKVNELSSILLPSHGNVLHKKK